MKRTWLLKMILLPLGHGRATESALALVAALYGILLLTNAGSQLATVNVTEDIYWLGYSRFLAVPFLIKSALSGFGVYGNIMGWGHSRHFRLYGAMIGGFLWSWYASKAWAVGSGTSLGFAASVVFLLLSVRTMALVSADLPHPGMPPSL